MYGMGYGMGSQYGYPYGMVASNPYMYSSHVSVLSIGLAARDTR
jgi:hypothetical protein